VVGVGGVWICLSWRDAHLGWDKAATLEREEGTILYEEARHCEEKARGMAWRIEGEADLRCTLLASLPFSAHLEVGRGMRARPLRMPK